MMLASLYDELAGLSNLFILLGAFALIGLMIWLLRRPNAITGFVIYVSDESVSFAGKFPRGMQTTVINFLRHDLAIPGTYEIRGRWDEQLLIIVVTGEAVPAERRIRNFLKITLKKPL